MNKRADIPVSVIVMTKNEERNIRECLESLSAFAEVFVSDSNSVDRTVEIARELGANVVSFTWNGKYPKKKQWCLDNLPFKHDWVLYVDADEQIQPALAEEIRVLMQTKPRHSGYFVKLDYVFLGHVLRFGHQVNKLVLLDRRKGKFLDYDDLDAANMWEVEGHYQPEISGSVGRLKGRILHDDHDALYSFFDRQNRYTDWEAHLRAKGKLSNPRESQLGLRSAMKRVFNALPMRGVVAFVHCYFLRLGFLDGPAGFHFALWRGFY